MTTMQSAAAVLPVKEAHAAWKETLALMRDALDVRLFTLGGSNFTLGSLLAGLVALVVLLVFARWQRRWMSQRLLRTDHLDPSTRETVSALTQYLVLTVGFVAILDFVGVRLSSFTVLVGAVGVGVGFGMQNIFANFMSGLIIMFERPIKIGDHVVLAGVDGDVVAIGIRATTLRTAQGSLVAVPNQAIISNNVLNWSIGFAGDGSLVSLQFRMAGGVEEDKAFLLRVLADNPGVLKTPAPAAFVVAADHGGYLIEVHFGALGDATERLEVVSALYSTVLAELARAGKSLAA
jgi:small-conductance mechanosensitive channel